MSIVVARKYFSCAVSMNAMARKGVGTIPLTNELAGAWFTEGKKMISLGEYHLAGLAGASTWLMNISAAIP